MTAATDFLKREAISAETVLQWDRADAARLGCFGEWLAMIDCDR